MKVICVILCLIISASVPAYADSILWSKAHSSTSLVKDEQWLESALQADEAIAVEPLLMEATAETTETSEEVTSADPPVEEGVEDIVEDMETSIPTPSEMDIEPLEDIPTPSEMDTIPEEGVEEDMDEPIYEGD